VSVQGNSGSGKTTTGRKLAAALGVPFVELDAIHHQPGWTELPTEEFRARVAEVCAGEGWVVDGNYSKVRDLVWNRADTVVWLDLPERTAFRRVLWRTLRRGVTRAELWNGNREHLSWMLKTKPEESIVLWSLTHHGTVRRRMTAAVADPANAHLSFVRLRSPAEVRGFLAGVAAGAGRT